MRNCSQQAISPFPSVFSSHSDNYLPFSSTLKLSSANSLEESKICRKTKSILKGGYLDFSHLTELENIYIPEIYMRKQYK